MDSSTKDGSCYIDGVPLKISPKFYPPRPVALPLTLDTKTPSDLLAEQYDFSLERNVIDFIEKRQAELLESPKEKGGLKPEDPPESEPVKPNPQRVLPWQSNSILQPQQPLDQVPSTAGHAQDDIKINLSDFENDTSSPFDYMELQTINDLEELNSVFQGIHNKSSGDRTTVQEGSRCNEGSSEPSCDVTSNVAKSVSFPLPQNNPYALIPNSLSEDFTSVGKCALLTDSSRFASTFSRDFSCDNSSYSTLSQVPYVSSNSASLSTRGMPERASALRGCKSYSDIHSLSDVEVPHSVKERSRTPPTVHPEMSEPQVRQLPLNEDYFGRESSNGVSVCDTSAYEELDEAARHFVDCITEMGFVKGQVARAVKHLGTDEKKVVEHLCQIQMLEESGYESSEAEAALHLHDYNRDQAKAFLDLVIRFQDLGFEKDAVKKALVQNKNDWNKTIDALLP